MPESFLSLRAEFKLCVFCSLTVADRNSGWRTETVSAEGGSDSPMLCKLHSVSTAALGKVGFTELGEPPSHTLNMTATFFVQGGCQ